MSYTSVFLFVLWIYVASCFDNKAIYDICINRVRELLRVPIAYIQRLLPNQSEKTATIIIFVVGLLITALFRNDFETKIPFYVVLVSRVGKFLAFFGNLLLIKSFFDLRVKNSRTSLTLPLRNFLEFSLYPASKAFSLPIQTFIAVVLVVAGNLLGQYDGHPIAFPNLNLVVIITYLIDLLQLLSDLIYTLTILSIIASFSQLWSLKDVTSGWLDSITLSIFERRFILGVFDISPIFLYIVIRIINSMLIELLHRSPTLI